jgi:hypothetical protein
MSNLHGFLHAAPATPLTTFGALNHRFSVWWRVKALLHSWKIYALFMNFLPALYEFSIVMVNWCKRKQQEIRLAQPVRLNDLRLSVEADFGGKRILT